MRNIQRFPIGARWATPLALALFMTGCGKSGSDNKVDTAPPGPPPGPVAAPQGGPLIPRPDLKMKSQLGNLRNIGLAYRNASLLGPVKDKETLKQFLEGGDKFFICPRDDQPYEIVYRVNLSNLPQGSSNTLLAWEATPDNKGGRNVLMADCSTVKYMAADEFDRTPKANPNQ